MKKFGLLYLIVLIISCNANKPISNSNFQGDFTLAFGSCNKTSLPNLLWDDVLSAGPDVWIWGGDIIYADTDDMSKLKKMYDEQDAVKGYKNLTCLTKAFTIDNCHTRGLEKTWIFNLGIKSPPRKRTKKKTTNEK